MLKSFSKLLPLTIPAFVKVSISQDTTFDAADNDGGSYTYYSYDGYNSEYYDDISEYDNNEYDNDDGYYYYENYYDILDNENGELEYQVQETPEEHTEEYYNTDGSLEFLEASLENYEDIISDYQYNGEGESEGDYYNYQSNFGADGGDPFEADSPAYYYDYYNPNVEYLYEEDSVAIQQDGSMEMSKSSLSSSSGDGFVDGVDEDDVMARSLNVIGLNHNLPRNKQYWSKTQLKNKKKIATLNKMKTSPIGLLTAFKIALGMKITQGPVIKRFTDYGCWCLQTSEDPIPQDVPTVDDYDKSCKALTMCERCVEMDNFDGDGEGQGMCGKNKQGHYPDYNVTITREGEINCHDKLNTCEHAYCMCHKQFVESFPERLTGNREHLKINFTKEIRMRSKKQKKSRRRGRRETTNANSKKTKKTGSGRPNSGKGRQNKGSGRPNNPKSASNKSPPRKKVVKTGRRNIGVTGVQNSNSRETSKSIIESLHKAESLKKKKKSRKNASRSISGSGGRTAPAANLVQPSKKQQICISEKAIAAAEAAKQALLEPKYDHDGLRSMAAAPLNPLHPKRKKPSMCCGVYPFRYPYAEDDTHKCCGNKTYNILMSGCCANGNKEKLFNKFTHECCESSVRDVGTC